MSPQRSAIALALCSASYRNAVGRKFVQHYCWRAAFQAEPAL
jgi:hypothetical protein